MDQSTRYGRCVPITTDRSPRGGVYLPPYVRPKTSLSLLAQTHGESGGWRLVCTAAAGTCAIDRGAFVTNGRRASETPAAAKDTANMSRSPSPKSRSAHFPAQKRAKEIQRRTARLSQQSETQQQKNDEQSNRYVRLSLTVIGL